MFHWPVELVTTILALVLGYFFGWFLDRIIGREDFW